jgi:Zn-dependent M28 family amino/carboxypeptidase
VAIEKWKPALVVLLGARPEREPDSQPQLREAESPVPVPIIRVFETSIRAAIASAKPGPLETTVSAHIPEPAVTPVILRNVIGVLRGSDPALKDTYVLLSSHYDHVGLLGSGPGDHIFNGANDDASGTASVIGVASALAALPATPKRSIAFLTFFGEERGEMGSNYYVAHPAFPLAKTVADINLEQMGRTDDVQGARLLQMNATGFDYTTIVPVFAKAGEESGIRVVKDEANSDPFYRDSDNFPFAEAGVPSHTFSVTYQFPDYHKPGDEWPKLDYENMARVDRAVALGVWKLADSAETPQWNVINPKTEPYLHGTPFRAAQPSR